MLNLSDINTLKKFQTFSNNTLKGEFKINLVLIEDFDSRPVPIQQYTKDTAESAFESTTGVDINKEDNVYQISAMFEIKEQNENLIDSLFDIHRAVAMMQFLENLKNDEDDEDGELALL